MVSVVSDVLVDFSIDREDFCPMWADIFVDTGTLCIMLLNTCLFASHSLRLVTPVENYPHKNKLTTI